MLSCVDNPETQSLKAMIVSALREPSFTLEAVDEILSQTFVNAMDGATSPETTRDEPLTARSSAKAMDASSARLSLLPVLLPAEGTDG